MSSFLQERFGKRSSSRTDLYNSLISVRRQRLNYALNDSLIGEEVLSEPLGRMKGIVRTCVSGWSSGGLTRRREDERALGDRKSTRLNSSHSQISYAVFCLKKKKK